MGKTREIKTRITAVSNIARITKTMQMIATSKFARASHSATAAKPYTEGIFDLVRQLAATGADIDHPLISGPTTGPKPNAKNLLLVLTSDRGLCGAYNSNVLRTVSKHLKSSTNNDLELVGKKGAAFLRFAGHSISRHHTHFTDKPRREDLDYLANEYMDRFTSGEVASVSVAYMRFQSAGKQSPVLFQLLPLKPPTDNNKAKEDTGPGLVYEFSPAGPELLAELLPVTVRATLAQCFSDAIVSEHVSRMIAMKAATDNASSMTKLLKRQFNRARQGQITTELTEIISGAAALE